MKTFVLCLLLLLAVLALENCAPYQYRTFFGIHVTSGSTLGGGLVRLHVDGTGEPLPPSGKIIDLPLSAGNLDLRYDPPYTEGMYRTMEQWFVDGRIRRQVDRDFYGFTFGNSADGTHVVQLIVFWAYAGDHRCAGTDTLQVTVRTWRDLY